MRQLRRDFIKERWVVISSERGKRPLQFPEQSRYRPRGDPSTCPFCPGNENMTPPQVYVVEGDGGWKIRVVPNKYPILSPGEDGERIGEIPFISAPAKGVHEVIIESPSHFDTIGSMEPFQVLLILKTYRERLKDLKGKYPFAMVFKNRGPEGGASLSHPHSQLIASGFLPDSVERELRVFEEFRERGICPVCLLMNREVESERLVFQTENFAVFCPYFSAFPFEVWIVPKKHLPAFEEADDSLLKELAGVYRKIMGALDRALDFPSLNMMLRSRPFSGGEYHWRMEIIPRLTKPAGFEWGAEVFVNIVPPERAALELRRNL